MCNWIMVMKNYVKNNDLIHLLNVNTHFERTENKGQFKL